MVKFKNILTLMVVGILLIIFGSLAASISVSISYETVLIFRQVIIVGLVLIGLSIIMFIWEIYKKVKNI